MNLHLIRVKINDQLHTMITTQLTLRCVVRLALRRTVTLTDDQKGIFKAEHSFMCYVIAQLQAYKADNRELINGRVPGAALPREQMSETRSRRGGDQSYVSEKPEIVLFDFREFCS